MTHHSSTKVWKNLECFNLLVAEFRSDEKETSLEHIHGSGHWHGVEVLQLNFCDHVVVIFQLNLENVALRKQKIFIKNHSNVHNLVFNMVDFSWSIEGSLIIASKN